MLNKLFIVTIMVASAALLLPLSGMAHPAGGKGYMKQIQETIAKVQTMKGTSMKRANEAEHLADLLKRVNPNEVDDETIANMISLLDTNDDSVRLWIAVALGELGPRAKAAVPALLKDIRETDCVFAELTSGGAARLALKRIGVTPPGTPNCDGKWKFPNQNHRGGGSISTAPTGR